MHMRVRLPLLLALPMLVLSACGSADKEVTPAGTAAATALPLRAIERVRTLLREGDHRPSAVYGSLVVRYLSRSGPPSPTPALRAVGFLVTLLEEQRPDVDTSFALLQELGTILQTDIPDMLNRSANRPQTLNAYVASLQSVVERASEERTSLEAFTESLRQRERTEREAFAAIERRVREAFAARDYALAGALQRDLSEAQANLSATEAERERRDRTLRTVRELSGVGEKRLRAIEENREVLIAGLSVVEIPGIEDLGILEEERRGRTPSVFGL